MKVSGVTTSHLIRQYEIESSRSGRNIGELDCCNTGGFSTNVFSALVPRLRYPIKILLLELIGRFSILVRIVLYIKTSLFTEIISMIRNEILFRTLMNFDPARMDIGRPGRDSYSLLIGSTNLTV